MTQKLGLIFPCHRAFQRASSLCVAICQHWALTITAAMRTNEANVEENNTVGVLNILTGCFMKAFCILDEAPEA